MCKLIKALIVLLIVISSFPATAKAESIILINDLIENANGYDGQELVIKGEAIGERMVRGDYSWININDGSNAIGVWLSNMEADKISIFGNYKNTGDKAIIRGVFYRACKEHGGEADFHASALEVAESGYPIDIKVSVTKIIVATVLSGAALLLFMVFQRIKTNRS